MIFLNHLVGQTKQANQTMHSVELGSPKPTKIKRLISEWMGALEDSGAQSTQETWIFWDDLLKVKVSVMNFATPIKWLLDVICMINPVAGTALNLFQEREKENADRNRLPLSYQHSFSPQNTGIVGRDQRE